MTRSRQENFNDPFLNFVAAVQIARNVITPETLERPRSENQLAGITEARFAALVLESSKQSFIAFASGSSISPQQLRFVAPLLAAVRTSLFERQEKVLASDLKEADADQLKKIRELFSSLPVPSNSGLLEYQRIGVGDSVPVIVGEESQLR